MQKKMKNEEFDHYIQSQFADEAITPPQQIEGAIFAAMAKNSRRKKLGVIGTGILVLGALAYGVNGTMNTTRVVTETPPVAVPVAAPVAMPVTLEVLDQEEQPIQKQEVHDDVLPAAAAAASASIVLEDSDAVENARPDNLEAVASRSVQPVVSNSQELPAILHETDSEVWVMPATVRVKE
mgnify:CR=1 FL=1